VNAVIEHIVGEKMKDKYLVKEVKGRDNNGSEIGYLYLPNNYIGRKVLVLDYKYKPFVDDFLAQIEENLYDIKSFGELFSNEDLQWIVETVEKDDVYTTKIPGQIERRERPYLVAAIENTHNPELQKKALEIIKRHNPKKELVEKTEKNLVKSL
jgi:hypothetical protein